MFNIVFGLGQGGGRLAKEISDLFKIEGRYINFADIDYQSFDVYEKHKLVVNGDGTGRSAELGEELFNENYEEITKFIEQSIESVDGNNICICVGGGGGSGTGMSQHVIDYILDMWEDLKIFLIYTIPRKNEALPAGPQSLKYLNKLVTKFGSGEKEISFMLVDNDYCFEHYELDERQYRYWEKVNKGIARTLKSFYDLTNLDKHDHIDTTSGLGALDYNELLSILFFKKGFLDIRTFTLDYPDYTEVNKLFRESSKVFRGLDTKSTKGYIIAIAMPEEWKGHKQTNEFTDKVFDIISRLTNCSYVLRSSFYSPNLNQAVIMVMLAGISGGASLNKIVKNTTRDVKRFLDKKTVSEIDVSGIGYER